MARRSRFRLHQFRVPARRGVVYIVMLFLLLIVTAMGLSFIHRRSAAAMAREGYTHSVQADYLAEAAANHAMWRLTKECTFPSDTDVYTMHELAGVGRYGYKVERRANGRIATVATVGVAGDAVAHQSYVLNMLVTVIPHLFLFNSAGSRYPAFRREECGTWSDPAATVDTGDPEQYWVEAAAAPTRREIMMGTLDNHNDVNVGIWTEEGWISSREISTSANKNWRGFDVAYESQLGRGLVLARDGSRSLDYNLWTGSGWQFASQQSAVTLPGSAEMNHLTMVSDPFSDEILIGVTNDALTLYRWNGSSFVNLNGNSSVDTSISNKDHICFDLAYESVSGDALVTWGRSGSNNARYAVWNGATLSAVAAMPAFDQRTNWIRLAPRPNSDQILAVSLTENDKLWVTLWDGSNWGTPAVIENKVAAKDRPCFDVAWEATGGEALVAWGSDNDNKNRLKYWRWMAETPFSSGVRLVGPDCRKEVSLVRLQADPRSSRIIAMIANFDRKLQFTAWNGDQFGEDPTVQMDTNLAHEKSLPYAIAAQLN